MLTIRTLVPIGAAVCALLGAQTLGALAAPPRAATVHSISFDAVFQEFQRSDFQLRVAGEEVSAARDRAVGAGAFSNSIVTSHERPPETERYQESVFLLGQTLEVGGRRDLRRSVCQLSYGPVSERCP